MCYFNNHMGASSPPTIYFYGLADVDAVQVFLKSLIRLIVEGNQS